ncbi:MAG: AI-2E family transporter [Clostridiales bacterium]|nr:AI-2E family transporter [Clostridiales bacterium]
MKIDWNRKYNTIAVYTLLVIFIAVIAVAAALRLDEFKNWLDSFWSIFTPVFVGIAIAYILNPVANLFEKKVFKKLYLKADNHKKHRLLRGLAVFVTVILSLAFIIGFIMLVAPAIFDSFKDLATKIPSYADNIEQSAYKLAEEYPDFKDFINESVEQARSYLMNFQQTIIKYSDEILEVVTAGLKGTISLLKNFIIGYIIAIYLMFSKDMFIAQSKKILFAVKDSKKSISLLNALRKSHNIFLRSIMATLIDSFIVGIVTAIAMALMKMPYSVLIGCIVGVTNLIPFFGPFLGAIPSALLILMASGPLSVFWFLLFILIMQQIDGNIIMPRIQGESTGIPAIWVLISITVGGGLFGVMGMVLAVPVFAVMYMFLRLVIEKKLKSKNLPEDTIFYRDNLDELEALIKKQEEERQKALNEQEAKAKATLFKK